MEAWAADLQLPHNDVCAGFSLGRLAAGKDAHHSRVIIEAVEGCAVVYPAVLIEHIAVESRVHALACQALP